MPLSHPAPTRLPALAWIDDIQAIVFDLDGTLYRETHHFERYAAELRDRLPVAAAEAFWADYHAADRGEHVCRFGRVYDMELGNVLALDGLPRVSGTTPVAEAWTWTGEPLGPDDLAASYGAGVDLHPRRFANIGDTWNVAYAAARHYGLDRATVDEAFLATRDYMASPEFEMEPVPGLAPALRRLKGRVYLALATNSPQACSEVLVDKLDLTGVFDAFHFSARKPRGLTPVLEATAAAARVGPAALLSVGDNRRNDVLPAHAYGSRGVLLDANGLFGPDAADLVLPHIGELVPLLEQLAA